MFAAQEDNGNRDDSGKQQRREQDHGRRTGRRRCTVLRPRGGCCRGRLRCCLCGRLRGYGCGGLRCGFGCDFGLFRCRNLGRFCRGFGCIGLRRAGVVRLRRHSICIAARADIVHKIVSERGNRLVQHGAAAAAEVGLPPFMEALRLLCPGQRPAVRRMRIGIADGQIHPQRRAHARPRVVNTFEGAEGIIIVNVPNLVDIANPIRSDAAGTKPPV